MNTDEMNDQIDQLEHDMWVPITPTTEAEKIVAALNALNRSLPGPAHATQLLKVSWLLQARISHISATFSSRSPLPHPPPDRLSTPFLRLAFRLPQVFQHPQTRQFGCAQLIEKVITRLTGFYR